MKKIKLLSLAALTILAFACTKEQQEEPVAKDTVTLKTASMTVGKKGVTGAAGSAAVIEFTANNDWTATPNVDWITLDATSGKAGDVKLNVTVAENETYEERSGEVVIACGEAKAKVSIKQTLSEVFGVAIAKELSYEEQTLELAVGTNMDYDVTFDFGGAEAWITWDKSKAEPSLEGVTLYVEPNLSNLARTADVFIGNDQAMLQYVITQESLGNSMISSVLYLGNRQKPYDTNIYTFTTFAQYGFGLAKVDDETDIAQVIINVNKADADKAVLPTGTFVCDAAADHSAGTFSIKPADNSELAYTMIFKGENIVEVLDGTVEITKNGEDYDITCNLMDENGEITKYKYIGACPAISDNGLGQVVYTTYMADYNTHFASAANQWNAEAYVSETIPDESEYVYKLGFALYGEAGEVKMENIPAGTYTFATPQTDSTGYASGNLNAQPFTFTSSGVYSDYDVEAGTYRQGDITGGTITISEVDAEKGIMSIAYDLNLKTYHYNWDTYEEEDVREFKYTCDLGANKYIASDSGQRPVLDEDQVFTGCMISAKYVDYWYGADRFGVKGTNIFWWGLQYVNNTFNVNIPISSTGEWEFVANMGKYCTTPLPEGTYYWSDAPAGDCICNIGTPASRKGIVTNSYTGKTAYICGGSITITDTHLDFNLTAKVDGKEVHYTGGFDASLYYSRDSHSSSITWGVIPDKITLNAANISTNDPMQYETQGQNPDEYGFGSPDWFNPIDAGQKSAREAKYGKAENMWDDDKDTSFHLNLDWGNPYTSWGLRDTKILADNSLRYIEISLPAAENKVNLEFTTSDSGNKAAGLDIQYSTDGTNFTKFGETQTVSDFGQNYFINGIQAGSGDIAKLRIVNTSTNADWTYTKSAFGISELKVYRAK